MTHSEITVRVSDGTNRNTPPLCPGSLIDIPHSLIPWIARTVSTVSASPAVLSGR